MLHNTQGRLTAHFHSSQSPRARKSSPFRSFSEKITCAGPLRRARHFLTPRKRIKKNILDCHYSVSVTEPFHYIWRSIDEKYRTFLQIMQHLLLGLVHGGYHNILELSLAIDMGDLQ